MAPCGAKHLHPLASTARLVVGLTTDFPPRTAAQKHMDVDGSGQISFRELARMVRLDLQLSKSEMTQKDLLSLWRALDEDSSGYICAVSRRHSSTVFYAKSYHHYLPS